MAMQAGMFILCILALLSFACEPIVVRVGQASQREEGESSFTSSQESDLQTYASWNSIEDFLQHLDHIKKLGTDALLKRYHEDGRLQIRNLFRRFRDSVEAPAQQGSLDTPPYLVDLELGGCMPIAKADIFDLGVYGDLRGLLETVFLTKLSPKSSVLGEAPSSPDVDELARLGFFELGIAMSGQSFYETDGESEIQGSNLRWKVIHEQSEAEDWAHQDAKAVEFRFLKTQDSSHDIHFTMAAQVGADLYAKKDLVSLPTLSIDYQYSAVGNGLGFQDLFIQTGLRDQDGVWQVLHMSRKISVSQNIGQGRVLHIVVSDHWGLPEETVRNFRLDMDQQNLCSLIGGEG